MSCSPFDLRDYFLKELPDQERRQVEAHVRDCRSCREELDRLGMTQAALFSLRDEEIPQRVAFVSDAIFEPSPWRRAWSALWNSGARLGFVSAAMLSAALVVFALARPAGHIPDAEIQARVDAAVTRAVSASQQQQTEKVKALLAELDNARQKLNLAAEEYDRNAERQMLARSLAYNASPAEGEPR
jgi:anti-sigma factor RsiW